MLDRKPVAKRRNARRSGNAVVEAALMVPWILLVFILVFDFGFYAFAAMATENAARAAVNRTAVSQNAASDDALACIFARREMRMIPNVSATTDCTALPLTVIAEGPVEGMMDPDANPTSRVSVTYQTPQLFPLPWLMGRMTLTRTAEMRIYR